MGLYFRKSLRMGPFRVNLSKAGVGVSLGVKGLRVGTGPRGNYIQMGGGGIYYRAALPSSNHASHRTAPTGAPVHRAPPRRESPGVPDGTVGAYAAIESASATELADSSSRELLEEIRAKHQRMRLWPLVATLPAVLGFAAATLHFPDWAVALSVVIGGIATVVAYRADITRKLVYLHYDLDEAASVRYASLVDSAEKLAHAARQWHIASRAAVLDAKYHAGAASSVDRQPARLANELPAYLVSNLNPVSLTLSKSRFFFFPDRVLVYNGTEVGAVGYAEIQSAAYAKNFIEEEGVASDALVVDRTWKYLNKSGDPDRRFKNNRQIPVCRYGRVEFKTQSGVHEILMFSTDGPQAPFVDALQGLGKLSSTPERQAVG